MSGGGARIGEKTKLDLKAEAPGVMGLFSLTTPLTALAWCYGCNGTIQFDDPITGVTGAGGVVMSHSSPDTRDCSIHTLHET